MEDLNVLNYIKNVFRVVCMIRLVIKLCILNLFVISLSSCATGYQKMSFTGGFKEKPLGNNTYLLTYRGNGFSSKDQISSNSLESKVQAIAERSRDYNGETFNLNTQGDSNLEAFSNNWLQCLEVYTGNDLEDFARNHFAQSQEL